jgi:hypothetical protein
MDENYKRHRRLWSAVLLQAFDDIETVKKASSKKEFVNQVIELMSSGVKKKDIPGMLGMKYGTFVKWDREYREGVALFNELVDFFNNKNSACELICRAANVDYDVVVECARKKLEEIEIS